MSRRRSRKRRANPMEQSFQEFLRNQFPNLQWLLNAGFPPIHPFAIPEPQIQLQIPPEMYRKLLMLCHPDKHGNSQTATEVTTWLLEQRSLYK